MSLNGLADLQNQRVNLPILMRDREDVYNTTSGSFTDVPEYTGGTANWKLEGQNTVFIQYTPVLALTTSMGAESVEGEQEDHTDRLMYGLERVANAGDEKAFIEIAEGIDWENRPPEDFLRAIQFAFAAGAHLYARHLSIQGADQYPEYHKLQDYARILAPPKMMRVDSAPSPDISANFEWLDNHGKAYRGQWVALKDGELLGSESTLRKLVSKVGKKEGVLYTPGF